MNVRAILNPLQLALFIDMFNSLSKSSEFIAKTIRNNNNNNKNENKTILDFQLKIHKTILAFIRKVTMILYHQIGI